VAWSPALLGGVVALLGLILAGGGAYLAGLGGSLYYVMVGAMLIAAGYLLIKRKIAGTPTSVRSFSRPLGAFGKSVCRAGN
jgi:quinoprotein glucose dehydrogenase